MALSETQAWPNMIDGAEVQVILNRFNRIINSVQSIFVLLRHESIIRAPAWSTVWQLEKESASYLAKKLDFPAENRKDDSKPAESF